MQRHLGVLIARLVGICLLGTGLASCSETAEPHPRGPGHGTAADRAVIAGHASDVLLSVYSTGGSGDPGPGVPDLEVRTDGTVFVRADSGLGVDTFRLTSAGIDQVRQHFATVSMSQGDYDESGWTDQPSTSVYAAWSDVPEQISVYGLGHDDEVGDDDWTRLLDAIASVEALERGGDRRDVTSTRETYRPRTVAVILRPTADDQGPWPLTTPLHRDRELWSNRGDRCLVVSGRDVVTLEALVARHGRDSLAWATGAPRSSGLPAAVEAEVRPILRGTPPPCTDERPPAQ